MGYVQTNNSLSTHAPGLPLDWESLGRHVQAQTIHAVSRHFLEVGLAELCLEMLVQPPARLQQRMEHE